MELFLIRHAETGGENDHRYIGATDEPLSALGIRHAVSSGIVPYVPHVYSSTAIRAVQTASIKFPNARMTLFPNLREMNFGVFERFSPAELANDLRYRAWASGGFTGECPGGEGRMRFSARTCIAFSEIIGECLMFQRRHVFIVAHAGTIMSVMERFARPSRDYFGWFVPYCGGYHAVVDERTWERTPILTDVIRL